MKQELATATVPFDLYGFLARALDYPDATFWDRVEGKPLADVVGSAPVSLAPGDMAAVDIPTRSQEQREVEYFSAFEGGVPAYEGFCRPEEGRDGILEDLLRFYHYFGLRLNERQRDFPDSFVTELEFMGYLVQLERLAAERGADVCSLRRAQRDFLDRHLTLWAERLSDRLTQRGVDGAYARLAGWLNVVAKTHLDGLERWLAENPVPTARNDRPDLETPTPQP